MKSLLVLCLLASLVVVFAKPNQPTHSRGCIYVLGRCHRECEEGTHAYTTGCGYKTPEATCEEPKPVAETRGQICDYSACYCDPPTVRDAVSGKCVELKDCPKKN